MEFYSLAKTIHIATALLSLAGFTVRGYWMLSGNARLQARLTKVLPHINDALLLSVAVYLVIVTQNYPSIINWITLKIILLIVYIVLGTIALKRGKTRRVRITALILALGSILSIFTIAVFKPSVDLI